MTAQDKTCPRCAETVKAAAQVCRFCSHEFAASPPSITAPPARRSNGPVLLLFLGAVAGLALLSQCVPLLSDDSRPAAKAAPLVDDAARKGCGAAVAGAMKDGIVKQRPAPNRVNVDEIAWARMAASDKAALLGLVACDAFGKRPPDLALMEFTVAYGWRSGKRLAMFGANGITHD